MRLIKHFEKVEKRKEWEYNGGGGELFKIHCTHIWNSQNETPLIL
jgi:hypothetical protein